MCLTRDPVYQKHHSGGYGSSIYGAEYQSFSYGIFPSSLNNHDVPCAVCHVTTRASRDAGTRKGPGGQTLLKGTDKILTMLKSITWNLEGQLHSSCAKFLPIIFLAWHLRSH